ncbi:TPA: RidA family protein [Serratia marcescens]|nr:RidA family protein [Serratia marcescens]
MSVIKTIAFIAIGLSIAHASSASAQNQQPSPDQQEFPVSIQTLDNLKDRHPFHSVAGAATRVPGISNAIAVDSGKLLFLSGHVPMNADGSLPGKTLEVQLSKAFENMQATLADAGGSFDDVARITIFVRDYSPASLDTIRTVRDRFINHDRPPASALIGVASLFHPDVLVEVDAIAVLPLE